jgi:hypothetical protein
MVEPRMENLFLRGRLPKPGEDPILIHVGRGFVLATHDEHGRARPTADASFALHERWIDLVLLAAFRTCEND